MDFSALDQHRDMLPPGNAEVARLRADAVQLLTQIDERENLRTQTVVPLRAGMWNALYRLEPAGVVAKLSFGDNRFEIDFLRQAETLGIPAPRVLGAGALDHPALKQACYFLMTYLPNAANAWHLVHPDGRIQPDALEQVGRELGIILAKLHRVHLGYITRFGERVESWKQSLADGYSPDWDNLAPNALFDADLLPIFRRILRETGYLSFKDGSLIHCDLNLSNVMVDADTHCLLGILDPAGYAGMPMFDVAYAAMPWDHGFGFYNALLNSYRHHADRFDPALFYTSILVVAYRHDRFHTPAVRESIFRDILPKLER